MMESALDEYLESLKGKRVAVLGLGISNRPLVELLLRAGAQVTACDRRERAAFDGYIDELERRGSVCCLGEGYLDHLEGAQVIFRTPGMRPDLPQIETAKARGAVLTSEM